MAVSSIEEPFALLTLSGRLWPFRAGRINNS